MKEHKVRLGLIEGWLSAIINIVLFVLKLWMGMIFGSVAMAADAWHTLSDSLTSLVVIVGFWMSNQPADKEHPFGHGQAEVIAAVVIATLLTVVGFNFMEESINRLRNHQAAEYGLLAIFIFLISMIIKEGLAQFSIWAGKKINSHSLIADGWHHRSDAVASGLIVVGGLVGPMFWWIDGAMGIGISMLIFFAAVSILREASDSLMGQRPALAVEQKVKELISRAAPEAVGAHHIHLHHYGDHVEMTLHVRLPAEINLNAAHEIGHKIECAIRDELEMEATLHIEPIKK